MSIDPPGQLLYGPIKGTSVVDKIKETAPSFLDLSTVHVSLDENINRLAIGQELFGPIPPEADNIRYWTLVNIDSSQTSGAVSEIPRAIGVPQTNFEGADLIIRIDVNNRSNIEAVVWQNKDGTFVRLPNYAFRPYLQESTISVHPSRGTARNCDIDQPCPIQFPVTTGTLSSLVSVTLDNKYSNITLNKPFTVQVMTGMQLKGENFKLADKLDDSPEEKGLKT
jgi:hypothetical protein